MTYPNEPGWKEGDTSREAAESMSLRAITLRKSSYDFIRLHPGHTADEISVALDESLLAIRPRISELRKMLLVRNHGRGRNRSGKAAHRWVVCVDIPVSADEINRRLMDLRNPRRGITTLRQARHCYVDFLNLLMDRIENGDEDAGRELKEELDEMQRVLNDAYGWV